MSSAALAVVTVNRVQDVFKNPVYAKKKDSAAEKTVASSVADAAVTAIVADTASSSQSSSSSPASTSEELSADELLRMWTDRPTLAFDLARYRAAAPTFRSVHIGHFFTLTRDGPDGGLDHDKQPR